MPKQILVIHPNAEFYATGLRAACPTADVLTVTEEHLGMHTLPDGAHALLPKADAIISLGRWANAETIAACTNLKWFQCLITGTDHLNDLLRGRGVKLTNAHGIHGTQMSELAILNMLIHSREVLRLVRSQAAHEWDRFPPRVLRDRTVAIIGMGAIATHLAGVCKTLGMTTIGVTRTPREVENFDRVEARTRLHSVLAEADFVVLLLPLTAENRHTIGRDELSAMKPDACLINIARGGIVDEDALVDALRTRQIGSAGVDVYETTPLPPDHPLWGLDNVFMTPHVGGQSDKYDEEALPIAAANLKCFVEDRMDEMNFQVEL